MASRWKRGKHTLKHIHPLPDAQTELQAEETYHSNTFRREVVVGGNAINVGDVLGCGVRLIVHDARDDPIGGPYALQCDTPKKSQKRDQDSDGDAIQENG